MISRFKLPSWEQFFATSPAGRRLIQQHDAETACARDARIAEHAKAEAALLIEVEQAAKSKAKAEADYQRAVRDLRAAADKRVKATSAAMGAGQRLSNLRGELRRDLADKTPAEAERFLQDVADALERVQSSKPVFEPVTQYLDRPQVAKVTAANQQKMDAIQQRQDELLDVLHRADELRALPGADLEKRLNSLRKELALT